MYGLRRPRTACTGARRPGDEQGRDDRERPSRSEDILRLLGIEALARYIVDEVQDVYRLQDVTINDRYIKVIVRQMLRRVQIVEAGETDYVVGEQVERSELLEENDRVTAAGKLPATDRSGNYGQARRSARPEGKRHRRPPDPGRYGLAFHRARKRGNRGKPKSAQRCCSRRRPTWLPSCRMEDQQQAAASVKQHHGDGERSL